MITKATILAVDDTPANLQLLADVLTPAGYHVLPADSGELALDAIAAQPPELILLDIRMPGLDGLEVCRRLGAREQTRHIPIILISAFDDVKEWGEGLHLGAVDYLVQPVQAELLLARVAMHLSLSRAHIALAQQAAAFRQTNAQLQAEIAGRKQGQEERETTLRWQQGISQVQQMLLAPAPLEEKLKHVTDSIVRLFNADFCRIWLIRPGDLCDHGCVHAEVKEGVHVCRYRDRCLHLLASSGRYPRIDGKDHRRVPFGAYKIGRIASGEDHKFLTNDAPNDPRIHNPAWARALGLVAFAGYQLRIPGGEILGVLALFAKHPIPPAEDALLDGLGSTLAQAIQQAQAEDALRASEVRYRRLFESAKDGILILDADTGMVVDVNPFLIQLLGFSHEAFLGKKVWELGPFKDLFANQAHFAELQQQEYVRYEDKPLETAGGQRIEVEFVSNVYLVNHHKVIQCNIRDITERKQKERERLAMEVQLRKLARAVDQSPVSIVITDRAGHIEFANPKFTQVTGYALAEVLGKNPRILKSGETLDEEYRLMWESLSAGMEWRGEFHNRRKDGSLFWETASISPIRDDAGVVTHFIAVKEDTSERKLLESKFLRAQRLEGIGSLASGIAHDLNNILAPILMCAPLLREDLAATEREELTLTIENSAARAVDIVKQLLSFGRGNEGRKEPLQIKHLIREMGRIVSETFPRSIRVEQDLPNDLWPVVANATQIHQVLLNLCVNARDAMLHGGHLKLSADNVFLDASYVSMHQEASVGPHVHIQVADTGTGIPEAVRERMFDPFFSTKNADKGTGLGLATVLGIVKDHHGFIIVKSKAGDGTAFHVYLPAKPDAQAVCDAEQSHAVIPHGSGQWVLVVDDELSIRTAVERTLRSHGYRVLLAAEGIEALQQFTQAHGAVAVVVTDLMMPLMDGLTLCRTLRRLSPATPIILSTGDSSFDNAEEVAKTLAELGIQHILHKPHTADELLQMLQDVLLETPTIKPAEPTAS